MWGKYSEDHLEQIVESVRGRSLQHPVPECGTDIRVAVDQSIERLPPRFCAICAARCINIRGKSTSAKRLRLTRDRRDDVLELHVRDRQTIYPSCRSPLEIMARFLRDPFDPIPEDKKLSKLAGEIGETFGSTKLLGFRIETIKDTALAIANVKVTVERQGSEGKSIEKTHDLQLVYLDDTDKLAPSTTSSRSSSMPDLRMFAY